MSELTKCLWDYRKSRKLTQTEVAAKAGIRRTEYINLESGNFVPLECETLDRIAITIDMDPGLLRSLYYQEFGSELRKMKKSNNPVSAQNAQAGEPGISDVQHSQKLGALFRSILSLPEDKQDYMARTIEMVMRNVVTGAA